jgi:hypothetical protein
MIEKWLPVTGYETLYLVSNAGNVKSLVTNKILSACGSRYAQVVLSNNGKKKNFLVHRLVAMAFIDNPNNYETINHKNGNRKDNRVNNLEWVTVSQNVTHAYRNNLNKKFKKVVREDGVVYDSMREAARSNNVSFMCLWRVCNKLRRTCNGFNFQYLEEAL